MDKLITDLWNRRHEIAPAEWQEAGPVVLGAAVAQAAQIERLTAQIATARADALGEAVKRLTGEAPDGSSVIPLLAVFAPLVSGNSQPCMSGDPRDRLSPHLRRRFDDAVLSVATALTNLKDSTDD